jgi:C1A family cysteine protease
MLCVGYSDSRQVFIVRNSWGADWGDEGYCYIPYAYMTNPDYCRSCWTIRAVTDVDFTSGVWSKDEGDFYYEKADYTEEEDDNEYEYYYEDDEDEYEEDGDDEEDEDEYEEDEDEYEEDDLEEDGDDEEDEDDLEEEEE